MRLWNRYALAATLALGAHGCGGPIATVPGGLPPRIALSDDNDETRRALLDEIPVGSGIDAARTILEQDGFECSVERTASGEDCLYCVAQRPWKEPVVRKWQIEVTYANGKVTSAAVYNGLVGP